MNKLPHSKKFDSLLPSSELSSVSASRNKNNKPQSLKDILSSFDWEKDRYISAEFQKYGYDLAVELDDLGHKALYMKLAKELPRHILEQARNFVKDAKARSKGRLFMWKLSQLKRQ